MVQLGQNNQRRQPSDSTNYLRRSLRTHSNVNGRFKIIIESFASGELILHLLAKSVVGLTSGLGAALLEACVIRLKHRLFQNDHWQNSGKTRRYFMARLNPSAPHHSDRSNRTELQSRVVIYGTCPQE